MKNIHLQAAQATCTLITETEGLSIVRRVVALSDALDDMRDNDAPYEVYDYIAAFCALSRQHEIAHHVASYGKAVKAFERLTWRTIERLRKQAEEESGATDKPIRNPNKTTRA